MVNKKTQAKNDSVQQKAKQMREAQAKADRRTRNIIIGVVSVLVVAIIAAIIFVIVNRPDTEVAAEGLPEQFRNGEPIIVSSEGVGTAAEGVSTVDVYLDYTCSGCVSLETVIGADMTAAAQAGEFNIAYHPVMTHNSAFNTPATAASLAVAAGAPEMWNEFHDALIAVYFDAMNSDDGSLVQSLPKSAEKVVEVANQVGIPQEVIDTFDNEAVQSYLTETTNQWVSREVEGREQVSTPEMVYQDVQIQLTGQDAQQLMASLRSEIQRIGS